jgi:ornithine cyclodeaminase/alanine dehydrogenase-like protein (mu-crystallin family)
MQQPHYVSSSVCRQVLTPARAIELAELALSWEATDRVHYPVPRGLRMRPPGHALRFHSKAVALPELGVAGCRIVSYRAEPDGSRPGAELATRLVVLMDLETGVPLAIVDEHYNYSLRTAAAVGVAARRLASTPARLGVIGAGVVARASIEVLLEAVPVAEVALFSRTSARCGALAEYARGLTDVEVRVYDSVDAVLDASDLIVTATTARAPIVRGALRPGVLLCAVGSNELDGAAYNSCDRLIVDDWAQTEEAGDIASLLAEGHPFKERLAGELAGLVAGTVPGRQRSDETIIVRTEGLASQDLLFAHWAWQEAERLGL